VGAGEPGLEVSVDVVEELGADAYVYGRTAQGGEDRLVTVRVDGRRPPRGGDTLRVAPQTGRLHLFSTAEDGHRLAA
jgi:multiple sugar transport system ATP-binding protein